MMPFIKIMHIDRDYQVFLMVIDNGCSTLSNLSLGEALEMMRTRELDLIVSEPQNMAIFDKAISPKQMMNQEISSLK